MKSLHSNVKALVYIGAVILLILNSGLHIFAIITEVKANYDLYEYLALVFFITGVVSLIIAAYFYTNKIWKAVGIGFGIYLGLFILLNVNTYYSGNTYSDILRQT